MPFYHVRITKKSRTTNDRLALDLSKDELMARIVNPFLEGKTFMCGGEPIDPFDVAVIHINETERKSADLIPEIKAERARSRVAVAISNEWYVTKKGKDVTRELITHPPKKQETVKVTVELSKNVFIVHGRDHEPMKELKTMLLEFGLNPIVLHEQPSGSRTIVEKLEKYSDVGYAFVILTPEDVGCLKNKIREKINSVLKLTEDKKPRSLIADIHSIGVIRAYMHEMNAYLSPRARQNVVLEFGYFMGLLSRDRVCCLLKGDVEKPSDMHGIVYVPFKDSVEERRSMIIKELKEAGFEL